MATKSPQIRSVAHTILFHCAARASATHGSPSPGAVTKGQGGRKGKHLPWKTQILETHRRVRPVLRHNSVCECNACDSHRHSVGRRQEKERARSRALKFWAWSPLSERLQQMSLLFNGFLGKVFNLQQKHPEQTRISGPSVLAHAVSHHLRAFLVSTH